MAGRRCANCGVGRVAATCSMLCRLALPRTCGQTWHAARQATSVADVGVMPLRSLYYLPAGVDGFGDVCRGLFVRTTHASTLRRVPTVPGNNRTSQFMQPVFAITIYSRINRTTIYILLPALPSSGEHWRIMRAACQRYGVALALLRRATARADLLIRFRGAVRAAALFAGYVLYCTYWRTAARLCPRAATRVRVHTAVLRCLRARFLRQRTHARAVACTAARVRARALFAALPRAHARTTWRSAA